MSFLFGGCCARVKTTGAPLPATLQRKTYTAINGLPARRNSTAFV